MPILSQVTVWQNPHTGEITCEVPAGAGRRKIALDAENPNSWGAIIKAELDAASAWEKKVWDKNWEEKVRKATYEREMREKAEEKNRETHRKNYDVTSQRHGEDFAHVKIGPRNKNSKRRLTIFDRIV